jgi:hypothetical protein
MIKYKKDSLNEVLKPGDIICVRGDGFVGKVIRWVTESNINHVALYIGNGLIIESTYGYGVRILPLSIYVDDINSEIYICRVKQLRNINIIIENSYTYYGAKYNLISQIGIFARFMSKRLGLDRYVSFFGKNNINIDGLWCSEFLGILFLSENIKFQNIDITYLSPSDIYNSDIVEHIQY